MNSSSEPRRIRHHSSSLRRANSLDSFVPGREEQIQGRIREVTFRTRQELVGQDWSGENIPRVRQQRLAGTLEHIGINLRRHYSFGSMDMNDGEISPHRIRDAVTAEMEHMRRAFERTRADESAENLGAVGGMMDNESPAELRRRLRLLEAEHDDLTTRHNNMLQNFIRTIDMADASNERINQRNIEIGRARAAEAAADVRARQAEEQVAAAEERVRVAEARAQAAEIRAGNAEIAANRYDDIGRGNDQRWMRDRRRTNFGEDDYNIDVTLRIINAFDGSDPSKLDEFLRSCKLVFSRVRDRDHPHVLELILTNKLTGQAMRDTKYRDIDNMDQLETELIALYGSKRSIDSLQAEMSQLRQKEGETVRNYGSRAEEVTAELIDELVRGIPERAEQRAIAKAIGDCARANFESGLRGQLQTLVRAKGFKTLHESVIGAIDLDKTVNGRARIFSEARGERCCYKCNQPGHLAKDCPNEGGKTTNMTTSRQLPISGSSARRSIGRVGYVDVGGAQTEDDDSVLPIGAYRIE